MRIIAICVIILGLVAVVLGILFIPQASSAKQKVADSLTAPVTLDNLDAKYDAVAAKYDQIKMAEEPNIQAQKAMPSDMYNYLSAQRALLGLAKSNVGTAKAVQTNGIVDIIVGVGLVLGGFALMRKAKAA